MLPTFLRFAGPIVGLSFIGPFGYADGPNDKAPPIPPVPSAGSPVEPVTPGTSVNGQGATVTLDPASIRAIAELVRASQPSAPAASPQGARQDPMPTPQTIPVQQMSLVPAAAPVTPVMVVQQKSRLCRGLGHLGSKLANLGQPTVTQGVIQTSVQQVQTVQMVRVNSTAIPMSSAVVPAPAQYVQAPVVPQVLAAPQAPRK